MARPRILSSVGASVLILALFWLGIVGFEGWRRHHWFGDAQATVVNVQSRPVTSAGHPAYLCEAELRYDDESSSRAMVRRYTAADAAARDQWLAKWASGTRHWLHYWRGSPDYAQASSVLWQDDPAWGAFWGRIPSYLHAGLGMLVLGAGLLLVGKRVKA